MPPHARDKLRIKTRRTVAQITLIADLVSLPSILRLMRFTACSAQRSTYYRLRLIVFHNHALHRRLKRAWAGQIAY